jgi:hypothetical protein
VLISFPGNVQVGSLATMNASIGVPGRFFFNTTYNHMFNWAVNRWIPAGRPDPRYGFYVYDEFLGTDRIGDLDWNNNSGTLSLITTPSALNSGVLLLRQATAASNANLRMSLAQFLLGSMDLYLEAGVSVPTLATAGEDFSLAFGLHDNASYDANSACTDGVYFTLNRAVNGVNWIANTQSNGVKTSSNSSTAAVAATFYRLGIWISGSAAATFYVNGTAIAAALTTNIPNGAGRETGVQFVINKTAGVGNSDLQIDYFQAYGFYNSARVA